MGTSIKNKIFVVVVIICTLAMTIGIGWLVYYAIDRFDDEVNLKHTSIPTVVETPTPEPTEEPTPKPTEEPTPEPTEDPGPTNKKVLKSGEFDYEYVDILSLLYGEDNEVLENISEYNYDDYYVNWVAQGYNLSYEKTFVYSSKDVNKVSGIVMVFKDDSEDNVKAEALKQFNDVLDFLGVSRKNVELFGMYLEVRNFPKGETTKVSYDNITCELSWNNDILVFLIYPETTLLDISSLSGEIQSYGNFLEDDERRQLIRDSLKSYDYEKIIEVANEYIEDEHPQQYDIVYEILYLVEQNNEILKKCVVSYDKVEKSYSVYYKGVEKISKNINVVPFLDSYSTRVRIGFIHSDWIFFESYEIATNAEKNIRGSCSYSSFVHDVLSGGSIKEYIDIGMFDEEEIEQIISCEEPILRFEGDYDAYLDHMITSKEKEALKAISSLEENKGIISRMIYDWENS